MTVAGKVPEWAAWEQAEDHGFTIGVEEELMLLNRGYFTLANRIESVMPRLPRHSLPLALPAPVRAHTHLRSGRKCR